MVSQLFSQEDTTVNKKIKYRHAFTYNIMGIPFLENRVTYSFKFSKYFSIVGEYAKQNKGGREGYYRPQLIALNPFTFSNISPSLGSIGDRTDYSIRVQYQHQYTKGRKLMLAVGVYYRYQILDSVTTSNGSGSVEFYEAWLYSEESEYLGSISQVSISKDIYSNNVVQIFLSPFYKWLLLFRVKAKQIYWAEETPYINGWQSYNPPKEKEPYLLRSFSIIGVNLGVRF